MDVNTTTDRTSRQRALLFWCLLLAGGLYFIWRGPWRAMEISVDLPTFYSAARAWLHGLDPYNVAELVRVYAEAGGDEQTVLMNVNPPFQFPLFAWLGALPYPVVKLLFVAINMAALGLAVWRLAVVSGVWARPAMQRWLVLGVLVMAPVHTTISQGQLSLLVLLLVVLMLEAHHRGREGWMGLWLALAGALKPQMVVLFGLYYLFSGRWRACIVAAGVGLALTGLAVVRMELADVDWLAGWRGNMVMFLHAEPAEHPGVGYGDYTVDSLRRFIMINLAPLIYPLLSSRTAVTMLTGMLGLTAVVLAASMARRDGDAVGSRLAQYAMISVACLLVFYNRTYSATLLLLPFVAVLLWWPMHRRLAVTCLACLSVFVVPGPAILLRWMAGRAEDVADSLAWWWPVVLPHQIYALLLLLGLMALAWRWPPRRLGSDVMPLPAQNGLPARQSATVVSVDGGKAK
ncbi:glycosyltransferase family 87 protein [Phycisphaerales bacterium AB-hyl4]|uniref:Glycosyltransferase family 87 protein n=1 Tax=Natronomicrosphaera hydrolytica TaxID=3242702 RepID=A0ABV4U8R0_9BACT